MDTNRITKKMIESMKRYYQNRQLSRSKKQKWDKSADLDNINNNCPLSENDSNPFVTYMEACAGTFFIWWSDGVQTIHNERQYWQGVVFTHTDENGNVKQYSNWDGTKCKPRLIKKDGVML